MCSDAFHYACLQFGIVLDAGSSHTSLYLYQWDGPKWQGTAVVKEIDSCYIHGKCNLHIINWQTSRL